MRESEGGWVLDAVWADGFHRDFTGTTTDLATTIRKGWFYCGQISEHLGKPRGTDPAGLRHPQFIYCLQNHDQIGNRALGERLHHQIDLAAYRAASTLCCPATPLLFMGQEWAATTPFLYFTDHHEELGKLVTEGRRREFRNFSAFSDPEIREKIPDPQAASTFLTRQLVWTECEREPHAPILRLYRALLHLRRTEPALRSTSRGDFEIVAIDAGTVLFRRVAARGPALLVVTRLRGEGTVDIRGHPLLALGDRRWERILTTEDEPFSPEPRPPRIELSGDAPVVQFLRPSAVILREAGPASAEDEWRLPSVSSGRWPMQL